MYLTIFNGPICKDTHITPFCARCLSLFYIFFLLFGICVFCLAFCRHNLFKYPTHIMFCRDHLLYIYNKTIWPGIIEAPEKYITRRKWTCFIFDLLGRNSGQRVLCLSIWLFKVFYMLNYLVIGIRHKIVLRKEKQQPKFAKLIFLQ